MSSQTVLNNYMEDMVEECLTTVLRQRPDTLPCTCENCLAKVRMEALNRLPAFYVTGKLGEVYGEYRMKEQQYHTDVMIALSQGIEIVAGQGHTEE